MTLRTYFPVPVVYRRLDSELVSIVEAAEELGVSRWQIYQLLHSRRLLSVQIGRRHLIARRDLLAFIEKLRAEGQAR